MNGIDALISLLGLGVVIFGLVSIIRKKAYLTVGKGNRTSEIELTGWKAIASGVFLILGGVLFSSPAISFIMLGRNELETVRIAYVAGGFIVVTTVLIFSVLGKRKNHTI